MRLCKKHIITTIIIIIMICFYCSLPTPLFNDPISDIIYSSEGELLNARISKDGQWRFPETENVPETFARSVVMFEDKRFNHHPGIDPLAMARAVQLNLKEKKISSGASTIPMQLIRLSRKNKKRSYNEKIKESLLALRLELSYSKKEIMNLYASHAPFGGNIVGIEAASWRYFGHSSNDLSWAEGALLAILPNSPAMIHPGKNRDLLLYKRNRLLKRCHNKGEFFIISFY